MNEQKIDRCAEALRLRKETHTCAQAVAGAFQDLTGMEKDRLMAAIGGFGGGYGGSHEEACGAISGGVLVLSLLYPYTGGPDMDAKNQIYGKAREFRRRFQEVFGQTRCIDLLKAKPEPGDKTPASKRLGVTNHCDNMVITAVEILEQMLNEDPEVLAAGK